MDLSFKVDDDVTLRLVEPRYAEEIYAVVDAHRAHIGRWLPWVEKTHAPEEIRQFAARALDSFAKGASLEMSVLERGRVVGGIGMHGMNVSPPGVEARQADIGYWLAADAQGRGLMTRSVRAMVDHAFKQIGLWRVTIRAEPENHRSWGIPQRLGFVREGTLRHVCKWNDRWVDHHLYAMLAEDWRPSVVRSV